MAPDAPRADLRAPLWAQQHLAPYSQFRAPPPHRDPARQPSRFPSCLVVCPTPQPFIRPIVLAKAKTVYYTPALLETTASPFLSASPGSTRRNLSRSYHATM
jgi:hypothetical protein